MMDKKKNNKKAHDGNINTKLIRIKGMKRVIFQGMIYRLKLSKIMNRS